MFGRSRKNEFTFDAFIAGNVVTTDFDGYMILKSIDREMLELKRENEALKEELKAIKSVVENPEYKPPKSRDCADCRYAVYSPWDNISVIGCRKDCLCEDFNPKEN